MHTRTHVQLRVPHSVVVPALPRPARPQVFFYRKPVWARLQAAALTDLTATRFQVRPGRPPARPHRGWAP